MVAACRGPRQVASADQLVPVENETTVSSTGTTMGPISDDVPVLELAEREEGGLCAFFFELDGVSYSLSCAAIRDEAVTDQVIGAGTPYGDQLTVNLIDGVDPAVMVAISLPGGYCDENAPDDEVHTSWSMMFPDGANQQDLEAAVCSVGAFAPLLAEVNGCQ